MELTQHWLDAQRATPSFTTNFEEIRNILDAPLPAALRTHQSPRAGAASFFASPRTTTSFAVGASPRAGMVTPGRSSAIHDSLIEKGKLYEQRREALRERKVLEEQKEIGKHIKKIPKEAAGEIPNRLYKRAQTKDDQYRHLMHKIENEQKEMIEKYGFKPKISHKGKRATARIGGNAAQTNWNRRKEDEIDRLRKERIAREMAEMHEAPEITARSQMLAARRREREGMGEMSHFEAMIERDRLAKMAWMERIREEQAKVVSNPKITVRAAMMRRENTPLHLYQQSFTAEERKAQKMKERLAENPNAFSPHISAVAQRTPRTRPVEEELMIRHLESLAIRDDAVRQRLERDRECHNPSINPVSDAIAARLPESTAERLYRTPPASHRNPSALHEQASSRASSVSTDVSRRDAARFERITRDAEKRKEHLEKIRQEREQKEIEGCTFVPMTLSRGYGQLLPPDDIFARTNQWERRKEMKLSEQRAAREVTDTDECTFQPNVNRKAAAPGANSFGGDANLYPAGMEDFIRRQQEARRRAEEATARQVTPTTNWRNAPTVPMEFKIGKREESTAIPALQRPLQPPWLASASPAPGTFDFPPPHRFSLHTESVPHQEDHLSS